MNKCGVCGDRSGRCGKSSKKTYFHIRFRTNFKEYLNVPCYAKKTFDSTMRIVLLVETEDEERYVFKLAKTQSKTQIFGGDYNKFLVDYDMKHGDQIRLDSDNPRPYFLMHPLDKNGYAKQRVQEVFVFKDTAAAVVITKGMEPTPTEIARINSCVAKCGIGLGAVFVHMFSKSDIDNNSLHIPKVIASVLGIPRSGNARLVYGGGKNQDAIYYTSKDGRLRFRSGLKEFAEKNGIKAGIGALITFHMNTPGLYISFDPVRY